MKFFQIYTNLCWLADLTLKDLFISENCIEIKIEVKFLFSSSHAFKAFIKPFEAPQRSVKIKI